MKAFVGLISALMYLAVCAGEIQAATIGLADFALNINGAITLLGDPLPLEVDASGFDFGTGLGTLSIIFKPGVPGNYAVDAFFDHEIDEAINTFFNEFGDVGGTPATGQSWEIDEPGFVFGDIFDNILLSTLDNLNGVPSGLDDDVSMAMGWDFSLLGKQFAVINFTVSDSAPSGFFLSQTDPDSSRTIFLSSDLDVVPEPGTLVLMGSGLLGLVAFGRRRRQ